MTFASYWLSDHPMEGQDCKFIVEYRITNAVARYCKGHKRGLQPLLRTHHRHNRGDIGYWSVTRLFAKLQNSCVQIYLISLNRAAPEWIIASLPQPTAEVDKDDSSPTPTPGYTYEFIPCDVTLIYALARDLSSRLPYLNFLLHSAGVIGLEGRQETSEGIDIKLASRYYSLDADE
ncbi:unnamed protein product [Cyclocybe aegerita]|uniref:Uncharacterized protein n=1 Tax=Cyclocybe aegerita TaxID=1973307 RepID=A0A8S0WMY4_CYCAE|nr:unnamed protein product [Cyclocybe aegerita]